MWEKTESTATLANFYDWGDLGITSALGSIRTRLARAAVPSTRCWQRSGDTA
jgi:hypothetical protein